MYVQGAMCEVPPWTCNLLLFFWLMVVLQGLLRGLWKQILGYGALCLKGFRSGSLFTFPNTREIFTVTLFHQIRELLWSGELLASASNQMGMLFIASFISFVVIMVKLWITKTRLPFRPMVSMNSWCKPLISWSRSAVSTIFDGLVHWVLSSHLGTKNK